MAETAGYSGTPLLKKLGIKPGYQISIFNAPDHYPALLGPLPEKVSVNNKLEGSELDMVHLFVKGMDEFHLALETAKHRIKKSGAIWVSWPKKASGMVTELNENIIRDTGLQKGLVDIKVCAVDETWSGLKFVYRLKDR